MNKRLQKELDFMARRGMIVEEIINVGDSRALTILEKPTSNKTRNKHGDCSLCQSNDCVGCNYFG